MLGHKHPFDVDLRERAAPAGPAGQRGRQSAQQEIDNAFE